MESAENRIDKLKADLSAHLAGKDKAIGTLGPNNFHVFLVEKNGNITVLLSRCPSKEVTQKIGMTLSSDGKITGNEVFETGDTLFANAQNNRDLIEEEMMGILENVIVNFSKKK